MLRFSFERLAVADGDGHRFKLVNLGEGSIRPAIDWCVDQFGAQDLGVARYGERWDHGRRTLWFRDERDAFEFRMRWC